MTLAVTLRACNFPVFNSLRVLLQWWRVERAGLTGVCLGADDGIIRIAIGVLEFEALPTLRDRAWPGFWSLPKGPKAGQWRCCNWTSTRMY